MFPCLHCTVSIFILPFKTHLISCLIEIYATKYDFHITIGHVATFVYAQDEAKLKPVHFHITIGHVATFVYAQDEAKLKPVHFRITIGHVATFVYAQDEAKLKPVHFLFGVLFTGRMKLLIFIHFR